MTKVKGHHDDLKPDYPTLSQFIAASKVLTGYLRGDKPSIAEAAKAGWVCLGFAESYIPEAESPPIIGAEPPLATNEDKAAFIEKAVATVSNKRAGTVAAYFNWLELAKTIAAIIVAILAGG